MAMDLTVDSYRTWDDLCDYMDGSAAVVGEMMLPVLGACDPRAVGAARDLGLVFQLTNFIRDVGEISSAAGCICQSRISSVSGSTSRRAP
jgi:15-cis-phytoene synthase